jgi:hypothetical protein
MVYAVKILGIISHHFGLTQAGCIDQGRELITILHPIHKIKAVQQQLGSVPAETLRTALIKVTATMPASPAADAKVLHFHDVLLRQADLELLSPGEWLNDQVRPHHHQIFSLMAKLYFCNQLPTCRL